MPNRKADRAAVAPRWTLRGAVCASALAVALAVVVCVCGRATGGEGGALLAPWSWTELAYGLSLRPIAGAKLTEGSGADWLLRMSAGEGYTIEVSIKQGAVDLRMNRLLSEAVHEFGGVYPSAVITDQRVIEVENRPVGIVCFKVPDERRGKWIEGQAFVRVAPRTFAMLRLDAEDAASDAARAGFEAVVSSLRLADPRRLQSERARQIARGVAWRKSLDPDALHEALVPERWLRVVEQGADVGYAQVVEEVAERLGVPGIRIVKRTRVFIKDRVLDSVAEYFLSDEGENEIWSIRTTSRPADAPPANGGTPGGGGPARPVSWAETGVRPNRLVTVSRQSPSGVEKLGWEAPAEGYLSLVETLLLDRLLLARPPADDAELGFYAYHPDSKKLTFRTVALERQAGGQAAVRTRATLLSGVAVSRYAPGAVLIVHQLADGGQWYPATRGEIAARWSMR